jgi:hypothetical protein
LIASGIDKRYASFYLFFKDLKDAAPFSDRLVFTKRCRGGRCQDGSRDDAPSGPSPFRGGNIEGGEGTPYIWLLLGCISQWPQSMPIWRNRAKKTYFLNRCKKKSHHRLCLLDECRCPHGAMQMWQFLITSASQEADLKPHSSLKSSDKFY